MTEREQLEQAIAALEAQRATLGDMVVEAGLAPMREKLVALAEAEALTSELQGERKLVTVMFADISGFTALAETMDPEAVRDLMNSCFERLVPVVEMYEGTVDKFIGDEIMALFGAPVAHENDPERALRAALEMMDALAAFNAERNLNLGLHFGINTGLVIAGGIGSEGRQEYSVMGDAVNLAARLEDVSEQGEILIGPDTYRPTTPLFDFDALEPVRVKGKTEPVAVYRPVGVKTTPGAVRGIVGLRSPLVGRDAELEQLEAALHALGRGLGSRIAITGEAGLGKSRLVADVRQAYHKDLTWAEGRALSYTLGSSYWVARDILYSLVGMKADAPPGEVSAVLRGSVEHTLPEQTAELYPFLAHLLGLPLDEAVAVQIQQLPPPMLRERMLGAFSAYVCARSLEQPVVLVWEDLHWADPSSLHLLGSLLPLADEAPLLLLLVFRPEGERIQAVHKQAIETHGEGYQVLELSPLTHNESTQLVGNLLKIENLPAETRQLILDKAEGNPFFLEELLRALIDAGLVVRRGEHVVATQTIKDIAVPDTLQGVIAARVDRLSAQDKRTLQTASVIGRVFQRRVLAHVAEQEQVSAHLDMSLSQLQHREFIRLREVGEQEYIFTHVLTQDVTYRSLLIAQRKVLHRVAGEAIEALFPERLGELAATLAYHFEKAEVNDRAVAYLRQAGEIAVRLSANEEAVAHFARGLELLKALPDTPERMRQELVLQSSLVPPLISLKGYGDPEVGSVVVRALELGKQVGDAPQLLVPLLGLASFYGTRTEYRAAHEIWEELLALVGRAEDPVLVALSHWLGWIPLFLGEPARALTHLEQVIDFYDPQQHRFLMFWFGVDPGAICLAWMCWALWLLGYPDRALKRSQQALALAQELDHPFTLAFSQAVAGIGLHMFRREPQALQEWAEATSSVSAEHGFAYFQARATVGHGWVLAQQGRFEEGIAQMRQGLDAMLATGSPMYMPMELGKIAEAYGKLGQTEKGLTLLTEALSVAHSSGERYYEAELYRLKGELLLIQGDEDEAEASFCEAIEVARQQGAKSWELRATVSLSRLWQRQGRREEARQVLEEIYSWFTEGFDTADLQEAKTLLEALSY